MLRVRISPSSEGTCPIPGCLYDEPLPYPWLPLMAVPHSSGARASPRRLGSRAHTRREPEESSGGGDETRLEQEATRLGWQVAQEEQAGTLALHLHPQEAGTGQEDMEVRQETAAALDCGRPRHEEHKAADNDLEGEPRWAWRGGRSRC